PKVGVSLPRITGRSPSPLWASTPLHAQALEGQDLSAKGCHLRLLHGTDGRARTSRPQVSRCIDVGVQGSAAPAAPEVFTGAVVRVHVLTHRARLRAVRGVYAFDLDPEALVEIAELLLDDPPAPCVTCRCMRHERLGLRQHSSYTTNRAVRLQT